MPPAEKSNSEICYKACIECGCQLILRLFIVCFKASFFMSYKVAMYIFIGRNKACYVCVTYLFEISFKVKENSVQFSHSIMSNSSTPWTAAHQASLSITISWSLLKLMPIESVMPSNHLFPCHPLLLLPSIFLNIRDFSNELAPPIKYGKVLDLQLQHQSFKWIFRTEYPLGLTGLISVQSKGLSRVFSNTTVQKHQFFGAQLSLWSNSHIHTWLLEKP